jgi:hypothetical protein
MVLRLELFAGRDLAYVAVVRRARSFVIDEDAPGAPASARPRIQVDGAEIGHILGADDVETFAAHEPQIGRVLLGFELVCHFLRNKRFSGHQFLLAVSPGGPDLRIAMDLTANRRPAAML